MIVIRRNKNKDLAVKKIPYNSNNIQKYKSSNNLLKHARFNNKTNGIMLINSKDDTLIGYCGWEEEWIICLEVTENYRGLGFGETLLRNAINSGCTKLSVNKNNLVALNLYKKNGFIPKKTEGNRIVMELG